MLVDTGIILFKFYLSVSREEQAQRIQERATNPLKQWKLSPIDVEAQKRWDAYTDAKEETFRLTDTSQAPWTIIKSDDKLSARLEVMRFVLASVDYAGKSNRPLATWIPCWSPTLVASTRAATAQQPRAGTSQIPPIHQGNSQPLADQASGVLRTTYPPERSSSSRDSRPRASASSSRSPKELNPYADSVKPGLRRRRVCLIWDAQTFSRPPRSLNSASAVLSTRSMASVRGSSLAGSAFALG